MGPQHNNKGGLKIIPRFSYSLLSIWMAVLRAPYRKEILWDIRWGFRREYNRRRNLNLLYRHHSIDFWFQNEIISAFARSFVTRLINIVGLIMTFIKVV